MKFNINNKVKVKLTPKGLELLKAQHDELRVYYPKSIGEFEPPKQDADGFTEFQLWDLMQSLGPACVMGCDAPFETEIEIPQND